MTREAKITESAGLQLNADWLAEQYDYLARRARAVLSDPRASAEERRVASLQLEHYQEQTR